MTSACLLICGVFLANFLWFIVVLNSSYVDYVNPKFITNSYDTNKNEELESILLKSLQKYIGKHFNTKSSDMIEYIPNHMNEQINLSINVENLNNTQEEKMNNTISQQDEFNEILKNYKPLKITNSSKISMFLNKEKNIIYIVKVSNERESPFRFDSNVGEVTLYYIPVTNFINEVSKPEMSLIKKCWSSKFFGRVIGAVSSHDKSNLSIFYRLVKGPNINYRIRYFHNISCNNLEIENTDEIINEKFKSYLNEKVDKKMKDKVIETDSYFEINESANENNTVNKAFSFNYFNDDTYDDFALKGNTPISAMAIKSNTIAYARDLDYRQFYILRRENDNNINRSWRISLLGPPIDKTVHNFFHTNSLKFANDNISDYKLFHVFLTMNQTGIFTFGFVIRANHTDYINYNSTEELEYSIRRVAKYSIEGEVLNSGINKYEDFNIEESIQKLKGFMKPTVFSNNNNPKSLLFEFKSGTVCLMGWSKKNNNEYFYNLTPDGDEKVSKISSDENNENIVIKFEKSKDMLYFFRYKEKTDDKNIYYDVTKNINFKSIPKKYRDKEIISYFIENVDNKIILFILNSDGVIISLDFTKISKKWQVRNWFLNAILYDLNYTASLIMFLNLISLILYFRFYRRGQEADPTRGRNAEINQVIQDIIRLNNLQMAIGGNLQNLANMGNEIRNVNVNENVEENQNLLENVENVENNQNLNNEVLIENESTNLLLESENNNNNINDDDIEIENNLELPNLNHPTNTNNTNPEIN